MTRARTGVEIQTSEHQPSGPGAAVGVDFGACRTHGVRPALGVGRKRKQARKARYQSFEGRALLAGTNAMRLRDPDNRSNGAKTWRPH